MMGKHWQQLVQEGMAIPLFVSLKYVLGFFSYNSCSLKLKGKRCISVGFFRGFVL